MKFDNNKSKNVTIVKESPKLKYNDAIQSLHHLKLIPLLKLAPMTILYLVAE